MAEIKAHEFDAFLKQRAQTYRCFLIYGPDRGLVSERASAIAAMTGIAQDDPFSFLRLDASDLAGDPGRLFDEVNSPGLFGGGKLIWLKGAGADKGLADAFSALFEKPVEESYVIVEAGDLKKGANLRKVFETERAAIAVPCYADDARALNGLIDSEMQAAGLRITPSARALLLSSLGGDRIASRNEIQKLALYARGLDIIEDHHVTEIIGDASAISTDDAVDAVLTGNRAQLLHAVQKVTASKTPIFLILQGCLRQFQLIDQMRAEIEEKNSSVTDVMGSMGRHIHFRRKPIIEAALRSWNAQAISREMNRLQSAILQSRRRAALEDSISMQTLLSITLQAARLRKA
ncbi:DNA polymerase III subunit delta [Rhizobium alvei]|uniref:DNA polymerase III subunit delta n=1 Tax=Rhizobium alvei TaxID=1132659 RepID=A0ABT8YN00_9HYPH|nr:DNA polymerase III subunit delta [Rhizobium alvei]MDO6964733.1 DNA polymerase III subunit delta [Rhizobium alvei]